jgi:hypothetical protein
MKTDRQIIAGRFYRGEDRSELSIEEQFSSTTSSKVTIRYIANHSKGRYYRSKGREWISGPQAAAPSRPLQFFTKASFLRKYRGRLALLAGQDGSLNAANGLDAWISTTDEGSVHLLAPALNFYPVVSNKLNGSQRVLSNIRIGAVPASLFEPPPGEPVTFVEEPFPPAVAQQP